MCCCLFRPLLKASPTLPYRGSMPGVSLRHGHSLLLLFAFDSLCDELVSAAGSIASYM